MAKVTGTLQKSTEIMKISNQLIRLPQFSQVMRDMSMEMTKVCDRPTTLETDIPNWQQAGIMDEMMEDVLAADEDEELDAEADEEVDKVLFDLTEGRLGQAGAARTELPVCVSLHFLALVLTRAF
jgi:charged multivesicular body protein 3